MKVIIDGVAMEFWKSLSEQLNEAIVSLKEDISNNERKLGVFEYLFSEINEELKKFEVKR